jgi:hypothetical protein
MDVVFLHQLRHVFVAGIGGVLLHAGGPQRVDVGGDAGRFLGLGRPGNTDRQQGNGHQPGQRVT